MSASVGDEGAGVGGVAAHPAKPTIAAHSIEGMKVRRLLLCSSIGPPKPGAHDDQDRVAWEAKHSVSTGTRDAHGCKTRRKGLMPQAFGCWPRVCRTPCGCADRAAPCNT